MITHSDDKEEDGGYINDSTDLDGVVDETNHKKRTMLAITEDLNDRLESKSRAKRYRMENEIVYEGDNDSIPTLFDSVNGDVVLRSALKVERRSTRAMKIHKYFDRIDHKYVPKISDPWKHRLFQPRNTIRKQLVSADELLVMDWGHELDELHYLERDQIQNITGVELPDSDFTIAMKQHIEERIKKKIKEKLPKHVKDSFFVNFLDETALLAMAKYGEELVEEYVDKETLLSHTERIFTKQEPPKDESDALPFTISEQYHGDENRFNLFRKSSPNLTNQKHILELNKKAGKAAEKGISHEDNEI